MNINEFNADSNIWGVRHANIMWAHVAEIYWKNFHLVHDHFTSLFISTTSPCLTNSSSDPTFSFVDLSHPPHFALQSKHGNFQTQQFLSVAFDNLSICNQATEMVNHATSCKSFCPLHQSHLMMHAHSLSFLYASFL